MSSLYHTLKSQLVSDITGLYPDVDASNVTLEQPKDASHGDFATNAAMVLTRLVGKPPRDIASDLQGKMETWDQVDSVEIAGPGFINMTLKPEAIFGQMDVITHDVEAFGASKMGAGQKVMVEFCSANPTGPIHAGHMRGTIFGDVLSRILDRTGFDVWREYLINDAGRQIRTLVNSVWLRYRELFGENVEIPDDAYPGDFLIEIAEKLKADEGDKWTKETDFEAVLLGIRAFCVDAMMGELKADLTDLHIAAFDEFYSEYKMQQTGLPEKIMTELREKGLVFDGILPPPKGKIVDDYEPEELPLFKSSEFGDDSDRPMKNSRGEFTYFGADLAYHTDKLNRGHERLINVWGADHGGAVKRLTSALTAVTGNKKALEIKLMQMVRFVKNGEPVKMSKRAGNFITLRQILDDVGPDAARFWFMNRKPETQFDFDLGKAIEKNNENPVFYVQYAHTRMCSVFRQRQEMGIEPHASVDVNTLTHEKELTLMKHLMMYPLHLEKAASAGEPHRLAAYAYDLASQFHSWYDSVRFLDEKDVTATTARLKLVETAREVLRDSLGLMGVSAPEKM